MNIKIHKINLSCMHLGMCQLWPESGHWVEILHQHPPTTIAIAEALDAHPLRGSQSSPPRRGGLLHPPHRDPGSSESQSDRRWEV